MYTLQRPGNQSNGNVGTFSRPIAMSLQLAMGHLMIMCDSGHTP